MKNESCIFDLYGTLVDIRTDEERPQLWREMADYYSGEGARFTPDALKVRFGAICRRLLRALHASGAPGVFPEIRMEEVFLALYAERNVYADVDQAERTARFFRTVSTEHIGLYEGAAQLLDRLRAQGRRVFLLTNAQRVYVMDELRRLGIFPSFDGIVISSDCGFRKPDRRIFELLLRRYGVDARTAVMIGNDGCCDIEGGRRAGLSTIYLRSNLSPREPLPAADHVLETMDFDRLGSLLLA